MAKKDKKQEIVMTPDNSEVRVEDEPMFESEAYTAPQPEAGSDVTVLKPVGTGGPVPIVAPKHNTIHYIEYSLLKRSDIIYHIQWKTSC